MSKSVIIIPSRLASMRLPNKPLIKIRDKPLIMHVYEKAVKSGVGEVYVTTCDKEIANIVKKNGGKFIMTKNSHPTGTDRVYEASKKLDLKKNDYIINVQGDEPMISPDDIKNLNDLSINSKLEFSTLAYNIKDKIDYKNENVVKVKTKNRITTSSFSIALDFSRKVHNNFVNIYHHYGIYLYKFSVLNKFINLNQSKNEKIKRLEQLRALENKMNINVIMAKNFSIGIDTEDDLMNYYKIMDKKI